MATDPDDRTLEYVLELAASPEEVWQAIATGEGLESWFAYDARVTPGGKSGSGGSIWLSWGPECEGESPITIWDPPHHLRQTEHRPPYGDESLPPVDVTVDYFIESRGGRTVLRIVQAGMGPEPGWDGEYEATAADWPMFVQLLANYVERHSGTPRAVTNLAASFERPADEVWRQLLGGRAGELKAGAPYELELFGAEPVGGDVKLLVPRKRFMGTIDALNQAMLVANVHDKGASSGVAIELSTYGVGADELARTESRWKDQLAAMMGVPPRS